MPVYPLLCFSTEASCCCCYYCYRCFLLLLSPLAAVCAVVVETLELCACIRLVGRRPALARHVVANRHAKARTGESFADPIDLMVRVYNHMFPPETCSRVVNAA